MCVTFRFHINVLLTCLSLILSVVSSLPQSQNECLVGQNSKGTCDESISCIVNGGLPIKTGDCKNTKRCCLKLDYCGKKTNFTTVNFTNKKFPNYDTQPDVCELELMMSPGTCGVSIKVEQLDLETHTGGYCLTDQFHILLRQTEDIIIPICGNLKHFQGAFPVDAESVIKLTSVTQSEKYRWWINVTQIRTCSHGQTNSGYCGKTVWAPHQIPRDFVKQKDTNTNFDDTIIVSWIPSREDVILAQVLSTEKNTSQEKAEARFFPIGLETYPFIGAVVHRLLDRMICNVALISNHHVLLPGHCVPDNISSFLDQAELVFQHYSSDTNVWSVQHRNISKVIYHWHMRFSTIKISNNLAILQMNAPIEYIEPICLPSETDVLRPSGNLVLLSRYGSITSKATSDTLSIEEVEIINDTECRESWMKHNAFIDNKTLCVRPIRNFIELDFSSMVLRNRGLAYELIGIYKLSGADIGLDAPVLFTQISSFMDWINLNIIL